MTLQTVWIAVLATNIGNWVCYAFIDGNFLLSFGMSLGIFAMGFALTIVEG
jgi:hypothetical protein